VVETKVVGVEAEVEDEDGVEVNGVAESLALLRIRSLLLSRLDMHRSVFGNNHLRGARRHTEVEGCSSIVLRDIACGEKVQPLGLFPSIS
jgi:hypothetical protein